MVFPEATLIRDFTSNVYSGDYLGAAMDIGGTKYAGKLFTVLKDSSVVTAFVKKVGPTEPPIGKKLMDTLREQKIYRTELPAADKVGVLDKAFDGAATNLIDHGYSDNLVTGIFEQGADLKRVVKADDGFQGGKFWLEEGDIKNGNYRNGWYHIVNKHITGSDPGGTLFPSSMTADEVKELVFTSVKNPREVWRSGNNRLYFIDLVPSSGANDVVLTATNPSGKILSSYPCNYATEIQKLNSGGRIY